MKIRTTKYRDKLSKNQNIERNDEPYQPKSVPSNIEPAIITDERDFEKKRERERKNNNNANIKQKRVP